MSKITHDTTLIKQIYYQVSGSSTRTPLSLDGLISKFSNETGDRKEHTYESAAASLLRTPSPR